MTHTYTYTYNILSKNIMYIKINVIHIHFIYHILYMYHINILVLLGIYKIMLKCCYYYYF